MAEKAFNPIAWGGGREEGMHISRNLKQPGWNKQVPGQPGLHKETQSCRKKSTCCNLYCSASFSKSKEFFQTNENQNFLLQTHALVQPGMYVLFLPSNENSLEGGRGKANFSIESSHRKTSNRWNQTPADKQWQNPLTLQWPPVSQDLIKGHN